MRAHSLSQPFLFRRIVPALRVLDLCERALTNPRKESCSVPCAQKLLLNNK